MATTTNYGWTTPDDTALVKDGASAIRSLGTSVDTTTKALNPSTTLGDIEYRSSTANTNTRLGIGTTGQVLSVVGGVPEWATASAGGMTLINSGGTTLTGASVTISSIPGTYKNLQLIVRNFKPATDDAYLQMRYNSDANARYGYGSALDSAATNPNNTYFDVSLGNDNSVDYGLITVNTFDYANTSTWKCGYAYAFTVDAVTTTKFNFKQFFHIYNQVGAINAITLLPSAGNFTSGTAFLYGVS